MANTTFKVYTTHTGKMSLWTHVMYLPMAEVILERVTRLDGVDGMIMEVSHEGCLMCAPAK